MKIDLPYPQAAAIFKELEEKFQAKQLTTVTRPLYDALKPDCEICPEWVTYGHRRLLKLQGYGWRLIFNECPSDMDTPETCLYDLETGRCYSVVGDHRDAFCAVTDQGFAALKAVWAELDKNPEYHNMFSAR